MLWKANLLKKIGVQARTDTWLWKCWCVLGLSFSSDAWMLLEAVLKNKTEKTVWTWKLCHHDLHSEQSIIYEVCLQCNFRLQYRLRTDSADHVLQMTNNSTTQDLEQLSRHRELHVMIIDISQSVHVLLTLEYHDQCHHKWKRYFIDIGSLALFVLCVTNHRHFRLRYLWSNE